MSKLRKIILSGILFVCSDVLPKQNESLSVNINEMISSIQKYCKNPEQLSQYQGLKDYQNNKIKNQPLIYISDIWDISDYPKLNLDDQCAKILVSNQIDLAQIEKQERKAESNEAFMDLDLLGYMLLKKLYEDRSLNENDVQKINTYEQDFLKKFEQNPTDLAVGSVALSGIMRFFEYNLDYTPIENHKIYEANLRFKKIFKHIYKHKNYQKFNEDVRFIVPVRLAQLSYSNEEYKLIKAIQSGEKELMKNTAENFSQFYNNKQLADQFHKDYKTDTDFGEVVPDWKVADLLTIAYFKLSDAKNVRKWIEHSSLITGLDKERCSTQSLVSDQALNDFLKEDAPWYSEKIKSLNAHCNKAQVTSQVFLKFNYQELIENYEEKCLDSSDYASMLLNLSQTDLMTDVHFYTSMSVVNDTIAVILSTNELESIDMCELALKENKIQFLKFYIDHMKPTAFSYQEAKDELIALTE